MTDYSTMIIMIRTQLDSLHMEASFFHLAQSIYTPADSQYQYYQGRLDEITLMIRSLEIILDGADAVHDAK